MSIETISKFIQNNPYLTAGIAIAAAGLISLIIWLISKFIPHSKSLRQEESIEISEPINIPKKEVSKVTDIDVDCLVADAKSRSYEIEKLKLSILAQCKENNSAGIGRQWDYEGKPVYWLYRTKEGQLSPIIPDTTLENTPSELYSILNIYHAVEGICRSVLLKESVFQKYGWFFAMGGAALFAMVLVTIRK